MRAIVIERPGGPEVLRWMDVPEPVAGPGELLISVRASAMNRADLLQRRGRYPAPAGLSGAARDIPGLELAGVVTALGDGVGGWNKGDEVMALTAGGAHAELAAVPAGQCLPRPALLSWEEAAAIPEAYITAADALFERARWIPGEALLLTAAASGVGVAAAQVARWGGGAVIGLIRSEAKRARFESLGFGIALDPADPALAEKIRAASGGAGPAVALDFIGAASWPMLLDVMAPLGRIVLLGTMSGGQVQAELSRLMTRRLTVTGTVLRSRSLEEKAAAVALFARTVLPRLNSGEIRPIVDRVVPLAEAARAHEAMERNENFGKIVLQLSGESRLLR